MGDWLAVIGLAVTAFVSTNIDDLAILAIFFSNRRYKASSVVLGQYAGVGSLTLVSILIALAATGVPSHWLRWLGILPIAIGVKWLIDAAKSPAAGTDVTLPGDLPTDASASWWKSSLAVAGVTFANGGDNVGVYVPMFVRSSISEAVGIVIVFAVMIGAWCLAGYFLTRNVLAGERIATLGRKVAPFVLMLVGLAIIFEVG